MAARELLAPRRRPISRCFTGKPAQPESAFVKLTGIEPELVLSSRLERLVQNDNTVQLQKRDSAAALNPSPMHFPCCPVIVHQFSNGTLGISYQGHLLARYDALGGPLDSSPNKERAATAQRLLSPVQTVNPLVECRAQSGL